MNSSWGLHWFRRDLRVAGNPALRNNFKKHQGRVLGIFCFDPIFLSRSDFSHNRFAFFLRTLEELKKELIDLGGDLLVLEGEPEKAFSLFLKKLSDENISLPTTISFNRDYEPFARERDKKLSSIFQDKFQLEVSSARDHLLFEPGEVLKDPKKRDSFYSVYTPFAKKWVESFHSPVGIERIKEQIEGLNYLKKRLKGEKLEKMFHLTWKDLFKNKKLFEDKLQEFKDKNSPHVTVPIPEAGSLAAFKSLVEFEKKLSGYLDKRDFPAISGTSRLSLFYKNGSLTGAQTIAFLKLTMDSFAEKNGENQFFKELIWREFYYHILWFRPDAELQSFLPVFRHLKWENDEKKFEAWKKGETGFPIVDAGMRELNQTGWMHNRVRMIVASFLTKDLLIDWRWGEKYFMEKLLDGDLAPNNGGWQWAASTGCDPQPYFRIFNPVLQSEKFDPEGDYIKKYIPELRHLSSKDIHAPIHPIQNYPKPIVNHSHQRDKALLLYKTTKEKHES
jgi:deoxyribodipyrimidine photo-lyase